MIKRPLDKLISCGLFLCYIVTKFISMNAYEALETMRQGIPVKTKKGLQGNSTSIFTTNSISIIFERFTNSKGNNEERMFSVRNFIEQAKDLEFYKA